MKTLTMLAPLALLGACQGPEIQLSHMSTLQEQTQGVVLYDDGQSMHAAMQGTTCAFDTLNGFFIEDMDLPTQNERILDTYDGEVLGASKQGAHLLHHGTSVAVENLDQARLYKGGAVLIHGRGNSCTASFGRDGDVMLPAELCDSAAVDVAPRDGVLYVGTAEQTWQIDSNGAYAFDDGADLIAWDETTGLLYLAMSGERHVWATDSDGKVAWHTQVPGPITDITDMGERGMVLVVMQLGDAGQMLVLDGQTGERNVEHELPRPEVEVTVSLDGSTLAVTLDAEVHFYDITADGEVPKQRKTLGSPPAAVFAD